MAAIAASQDVVVRYIAETRLQHQISIAVYNAADNNVVSGDMRAIEKLMAAVKRDGMRTTKLAVAQGDNLTFRLRYLLKSSQAFTVIPLPQVFRLSGSG